MGGGRKAALIALPVVLVGGYWLATVVSFVGPVSRGSAATAARAETARTQGRMLDDFVGGLVNATPLEKSVRDVCFSSPEGFDPTPVACERTETRFVGLNGRTWDAVQKDWFASGTNCGANLLRNHSGTAGCADGVRVVWTDRASEPWSPVRNPDVPVLQHRHSVVVDERRVDDVELVRDAVTRHQVVVLVSMRVRYHGPPEDVD